MKIEIKSRYDASVLFSLEAGSLKLAVEAAVRSRANLARADLSGANLSRADLSRADLAWANLAWANLAGANLARANLAGANLAGANLAGTNVAVAHRSDGYDFFASVVDGAARIRAGCHNFTFSEARAHWQGTRAGTRLGDESLALVDHLERMLAIAAKWRDA